jgi:hypothetical protein
MRSEGQGRCGGARDTVDVEERGTGLMWRSEGHGRCGGER